VIICRKGFTLVASMKQDIAFKDESMVIARTYNVQDYFANTVIKHCDLVKEHMGEEVSLKMADAPFLLEEKALSPQHRPALDGPYETFFPNSEVSL
jgi:hypothetical protein